MDETQKIQYQVGEAWKGAYTSDTLYSYAAVVQDPTGLSVYRSQKSGNVGHPLTDTTWWFKIIDLSSIKSESDRIAALNTAIAEAEALRVAAEEARERQAAADHAVASADHTTAGTDHTTAQSDHTTAGTDHQTASADHHQATADHTQYTTDHDKELEREQAETLREQAEAQRTIAENNRVAAETERHTQYTTDHSNAESDHSTYVSDHATAAADHTQAGNDHTASVDATAKASNVNATIDGMIVTITDKNGVSTSVNIGFDITKTYASVSAMNADAANVEEGTFVMIATTDTTSAENARLYVRNSNAASSETPFTFLCDLDQAATSAWADWFNNYKPTIESDHTRAENDHTQASTDHGTASSDHTTATVDHIQATTDHGTASADHTLAASDHTTAGTDHTTAGSDHTQAVSDHGTATSDHEAYEQAIGTINGKMDEISQSDFDAIFNDW